MINPGKRKLTARISGSNRLDEIASGSLKFTFREMASEVMSFKSKLAIDLSR